MTLQDHQDLANTTCDRINSLASLFTVCRFISSLHKNNNVPEFWSSRDELNESFEILCVLHMSYMYSIFDPSGTDIRKIEESHLSSKSIAILNEIKSLWQAIEQPILQIRHNLGFHGGLKRQRSKLEEQAKLLNDPRKTKSYISLMMKLNEFLKLQFSELRKE